jgi:hypothetical protein
MKKPMKKAGMKKMSEYGGMEMYGSKKAMMKHEKMEGKSMEKKEKSMYAKSPMKKVVKKKK